MTELMQNYNLGWTDCRKREVVPLKEMNLALRNRINQLKTSLERAIQELDNAQSANRKSQLIIELTSALEEPEATIEWMTKHLRGAA